MHHLQTKRKSLCIQVQWVLGHVGIVGNEMVDAEAKLAAQGSFTLLFDNYSILTQSLPYSKAIAIADFSKRVQAQWAEHWLTLTKGSFIKSFDCSPPSCKIQCIFKNMLRSEVSMFTQLCTSHVPLNAYLFHSHATLSPNCSYCNIPKTVTHYLLVCHHYTDTRQALCLKTQLGNLQL